MRIKTLVCSHVQGSSRLLPGFGWLDWNPLKVFTARLCVSAQKLLFITIAVLLTAGTACAQSQPTVPPGMKFITAVESVTEYRLDNGLRVLLIPDNAKPLITANLVYLVGSRHEGAGEGGMAHLLEHLLFKGTPTTPDPKSQFVARGMQWNGTTSTDRTNYYATFSAEGDNLDWYLGWLADAMAHSFIARRDLDSEMTVVRNEFERAEVRSDRVLNQKMLASAYQWHPYGRAVIGARSDIENVSIDRLQAFYRQYYQPDNAVLVVAGSIDAEVTLKRIAEAFGRIPKPSRVLTPAYTQEPVQEGERTVVLRRSGSVPLIAVAYHGAAGGSKAYAMQIVLREILTRTPSGRLHRALVEPGLAASFYDWTPQNRDPGLLVLGAVLAETTDPAKAEKALLDTLEVMPPVTEEELSSAKAAILNGINRTLLDAQSFAMSMTDDIASGDWRLTFAQRDWIAAVTKADVETQARAYLVASNRTLGRFIPTEHPVLAPLTASGPEVPAEYRGNAAAAPTAAFAMTPENIEAHVVRTTLPGDMKLALLPRPTRGSRVSGTFRLHWGTRDSLRGKRGDAFLLGAMMLKGAGTRSRQDIQDALIRWDSTMSAGGGLTGLTIDFSAPEKHLPEVLNLLRDALRAPVFLQTDFEQARRSFIAQNQTGQSDPGTLAFNALARHLIRYPIDDPRAAYTLPALQEMAKAATLARLQQFYRDYAGAAHSELSLVGPIDAAQVTRQVQAAFGDWQGSQPYLRIPDPLQEVPAARIALETPGKANASYLASIPVGINDEHPDIPALYTAVHLLGGRSGSRLWSRLREKDGLSYGVYAGLNVSARDNNGSIGINGTFAPQNRERFETALRDELQLVLKQGFSAAEVETAKESILRGRRQALLDERNAAAILAGNLHWDRTLRTRERFDRRLSALTAEQVNAALRTYVDPGKLSAALAGDFSGK